MYRNRIIFLITIILFLFTACTQPYKENQSSTEENKFSGDLSLQHIHALLDCGARIPGSTDRENAATYITTTLLENGWEVEFQDFEFDEIPLQNITAKKGEGENIIILGTHYDTRAVSDQEDDPEKRNKPVPGANDGGSGTAILLELSRILSVPQNTQIWLVFFDGEDQGHLNGWNWSIGADYYVHQLQITPHKVVIIDMVGDEDLNIYQEKNSDQSLVDEIWAAAAELEYQSYFIPQYKYSMIDDHLPFVNAGYPATLVIDFDYPYWHTNDDTLEHVSSQSLQIVGDVIMKWIEEQ